MSKLQDKIALRVSWRDNCKPIERMIVNKILRSLGKNFLTIVK